MVQGEFDGMPEPGVLRLDTCDGQVFVTCGRRLLYRYDRGDTGMRNLAIVALTDAGRRVDEVAALFALTPTYVSMLRGRAHRQGSAGLVRRRGRPPKLSGRQVGKARSWAGAGWTQTQIADRLGVSQSVISELLARLGPAPAQQTLPEPADACGGGASTAATPEAEREDEPEAGPAADRAAGPEAGAGCARIGRGVFRSRYAGAMLLYPYLHRVGADAMFATLSGGPARRYDDAAVLTTATLGFALGAGSIEAVKHLRRADAGPMVGLATIPELATLRPRLAALADGGDPLALQRAFAAGMLAYDPAADPVYFVDDHFKPYAGARPVAKGWNTKRRHAERGIGDTHLVDARGRAVVFDTGEPAGLASTLPGVLTQLRQVLGEHAPILLGFDRGGAYPAAFTACRDAGAHWVTYRRRPLAETTATARCCTTTRGGTDLEVLLADEPVTITGYGQARQLTLYEAHAPVLQILTSDTRAAGADLLYWLRARWRIENMFKYAAEHHGIDALADYRMDIGPDTRMAHNPARAAARQAVAAAEAELAAAERALPALIDSDRPLAQINAALPKARRRIDTAKATLERARATLAPIPAKVPATQLDPQAERARPRIERRGMQMVLRLLAFNAEAWLADRLNAYLADPDEYRAITRNLLHHDGRIDYTATTITVTLDRPDSPRIATALELLADELNTTGTTRLPGDTRPITYQINNTRNLNT